MSQKRVKALIVELFGTTFLSLFIVGIGMSFYQNQNSLNLFLIAVVSSILLAVLIIILLPISGALLNPLLVMWAIFRKDLTISLGAIVIFLQSLGAVLGAYLASYLFSAQLKQNFEKVEYQLPDYILSFLMAFGLIFIVASIRKLDFNGNSAFLIPSWFFVTILLSGGATFSNPALETARIFATGFLEISIGTAGFMILSEILGAITAAIVAIYIYGYKLKKVKFK